MIHNIFFMCCSKAQSCNWMNLAYLFLFSPIYLPKVFTILHIIYLYLFSFLRIYLIRFNPIYLSLYIHTSCSWVNSIYLSILLSTQYLVMFSTSYIYLVLFNYLSLTFLDSNSSIYLYKDLFYPIIFQVLSKPIYISCSSFNLIYLTIWFYMILFNQSINLTFTWLNLVVLTIYLSCSWFNPLCLYIYSTYIISIFLFNPICLSLFLSCYWVNVIHLFIHISNYVQHPIYLSFLVFILIYISFYVFVYKYLVLDSNQSIHLSTFHISSSIQRSSLFKFEH